MKTLFSRLLMPKVERPERAFDRVIEKKRVRQRDLKKALARLVKLVRKQEAELLDQRAEVARLHDAARSAARVGNDRRALLLLDRMGHAKNGVSTRESELSEVRAEARAAKRDLEALEASIDGLEREKLEAVARLESAAAKREVRALLDDGDDDAQLSRVRTLVAQSAAEASLDRELYEPESLDDVAARIELARLKARLLPAG